MQVPFETQYGLFAEAAVESREYQRGWGQALIQLAGNEFQYYQQRVAIG